MTCVKHNNVSAHCLRKNIGVGVQVRLLLHLWCGPLYANRFFVSEDVLGIAVKGDISE